MIGRASRSFRFLVAIALILDPIVALSLCPRRFAQTAIRTHATKLASSETRPPHREMSHPGVIDSDFDILRASRAAAPRSATLSWNGWAWLESQSIDANYLDLAFLLAKSSLASGRVGCAIVTDVKDGGAISAQQVGSVLICGANSWLLNPDQADCHAEANAIAESAALGIRLAGATCYVSKPPCKRCFLLLATAGIGRIVGPDLMDSELQKHAAGLGISQAAIATTEERTERRDRLASASRDWDLVQALRNERKMKLSKDERIEINWKRHAR